MGSDSTISGRLAWLEADQRGDSQQLRELHDTCTWQVNAAVEEGRLGLCLGLADEYLERALELNIGGEPTGCESWGLCCVPKPRPALSRPRRRRRLRRTRNANTR